MTKTLGGVLMTKSIPLSCGKLVLVDDDDFEILIKYKWHLHSNGYARCGIYKNGKTSQFYMHRMILNTPEGLDTDHIDHDKLNNCRSNLRVCTRSQNNGNGIRKGNASGYIGVGFRKDANLWEARIAHKRIGYFRDPIEAARAYDRAALIYFGEIATINNV
jgi:hypothetical protein